MVISEVLMVVGIIAGLLWVAVVEWRLARLETSARLNLKLFQRANDVHKAMAASLADLKEGVER